MSLTHEQWVHLGDVAESVKNWAITALGVMLAATAGAAVGVSFFFLLLNKIGGLI